MGLMRAVLLALSVALAGCAWHTYTLVREREDPTDPIWWKTETRTAPGVTWIAFYPIPIFLPHGRMPTPIYFPTEAACEAFRAQHPTYTKPDEVCQAVHAHSFEVQRLRWKGDEK